MAQHKRESVTPIERAYRLLQYLKRNSDADHPVTQEELKTNEGMSAYVGAPGTYNKTITALALALNTDEEQRFLPEEEWQVAFDSFKRWYVEGEGEGKDCGPRIHGLHYRHVFTEDEIDALIEGISTSKTLDDETVARIKGKILKHLTTRFYRDKLKDVGRVREPILTSRKQVSENLSLLRDAIERGKKVSFWFNTYDPNKQLVHAHETRTLLSPYYVAADGGRFYLIAAWDPKEENVKPPMSVWRVDLMTELRVEEERRRALHKTQVPKDWSQSIHLSHLYMFFDDPVPIRLRLAEGAPYTFLHDYFGDTFKVVGDREVEVLCSPEAMVHWALQYSDRVEVLGPERVREKVKEKIAKLNSEYMEEGES